MNNGIANATNSTIALPDSEFNLCLRCLAAGFISRISRFNDRNAHNKNDAGGDHDGHDRNSAVACRKKRRRAEPSIILANDPKGRQRHTFGMCRNGCERLDLIIYLKSASSRRRPEMNRCRSGFRFESRDSFVGQ